MKPYSLVPTTVYRVLLRRVTYAAFEVALLLAYLVGSLAAWRRSLHSGGEQGWLFRQLHARQQGGATA